MTELFLAAYDFISDQKNWRAITTLADYIVANEDKAVIDCDEIITVLEAGRHYPQIASFHPVSFQC